MTSPETIAAGLTDADIKDIKNSKHNNLVGGFAIKSNATKQVIIALIVKGIIKRSYCYYMLTPLGIAVRKTLLEDSK